MRIIVDRELCVGAGQCVLAAPDVFDQCEQDGRVVLRPDSAIDEAAMSAVIDLCPSMALSIDSKE
jgi:ferredoxin